MKYLNLIIRVLIVPVVLIAALIGLLSYAEISLPLESAREQFIKKATELTGSKVRIDGDVRLAITFFPTLVVNKLLIENAPGWSTANILSVEETRVHIAFLPLFSGQLEFVEVSASDIQINLQQRKDGSTNWRQFINPEHEIKEKDLQDRNKQKRGKNIWIAEFSLTNVTLNYIDDSLGQKFTNQVDLLLINTHDKNRLTAEIEGSSKGYPYRLTATSSLLRNLINNKPWQMDIQGQVSGKPVDLAISISQATPELAGEISFNTGEIEIGKVLSWLRLVDGMDFYSNTLSFTAKIKGDNLKSIFNQSEFTLQLENGYLNLHDPADTDFKKISFTTSTLSALKNKPVTFDFTGKMNGETIEINLLTNKVSEFFTDLKKIHLDMTTKAAKSTIRLTGDLDIPVSLHTFEADVDITGEKLDSWNGFYNSSIPPFGPYELKGNIRFDKQGVRIKNALLTIGSSDLGGTVFINTAGTRTHWDIDLVSRSFQINDFKVEGYSLFPENMKGNKTLSGKSATATSSLPVSQQPFTTGKRYPNTRATLKLEARQVLSGKDKLGNGMLHMELTENSLTIGSLNLDLPGGAIKGALSIEQHSGKVTGKLSLDMDKFDYGVLYRYLEPESTYDGLISTRVKLDLSGQDIQHLMNNANGQIDFAIWPDNIGAGVLNIWSVNLFLALLPELKNKESKLNCATALLDIKDGQLNEELLFIDTTKIWMKGNINVDFPEEKLSVTLFPTTKKARIFGLQVPIRLQGTFTDIGVAIRPFDIVKAYVSFITSPLHAPFRRAFDKKAGDNLSELCGELLDRDYLRAMLKKIEEQTPSIDEMYE